ncbi:MAG TPA: hypothetical protein VHL77_07390, partial [Ferruginibacter sp.]|nr:hypothetical protein [Ferruginibacter sp.]
MKDFQYITNSHPGYIEGLYYDFVKDPNSVDVDLRKFFEGFDFAISSNAIPTALNGKEENTSTTLGTSAKHTSTTLSADLTKEFAVYQLIQAYRKKG